MKQCRRRNPIRMIRIAQVKVSDAFVVAPMTLDQCFLTFFGSQHPYLLLKITGSTPSGFIRYKDQGIVIIGGTPGTPGTSSRHPG